MPKITLEPIPPDGRMNGRPSAASEIAQMAIDATIATPGYGSRQAPWVGYAAFAGDACVGTCAFKDAPLDGRVEIAYFAFPDHEGRGIATAMARELVALARAADDGLTIVARTLPAPGASTRVLEKLRFVRAGTVDDPQAGPVWEWRLAPEPSHVR